MRTSILLFGALTLLACNSLRRLDVQPELVPKFDVTWDDDLDETARQLVVNFSTERWAETLMVGDHKVPPGSALQIVVTKPFSSGKQVSLDDPATGSSFPIAFEAYTSEPNPNYPGFEVVPSYSKADGGMWLHLVVGVKAKEGVRILVKPFP